jgi:hypothetical protein
MRRVRISSGASLERIIQQSSDALLQDRLMIRVTNTHYKLRLARYHVHTADGRLGMYTANLLLKRRCTLVNTCGKHVRPRREDVGAFCVQITCRQVEYMICGTR